jgi:hypothetical protein
MLPTYIISFILGWMVNFHPFYISLTEVRYNSGSQRFEVAQKIFWDDLEEVLAAESGDAVNFLNPKDPEVLHMVLSNYLLTKNKVKVDGRSLELKFLGYEVEEDAAWFYLESEKAKKPKELWVSNELLIDQFPGQQNIVHIYLDKKPKTLMLDKRKREGSVQLKN